LISWKYCSQPQGPVRTIGAYREAEEVHRQDFHGINKKQVTGPKIGAHQHG